MKVQNARGQNSRSDCLCARQNVEFLCVCNSWRGADGEGASVSSKRSLEMFSICMRSLLLGFHRILELGSECIIGKLL